MSDYMHHGVHEPRGLRDGAMDGPVMGGRATRRDEIRVTAAGSRGTDEWTWGVDGNPDAQPDHGERNG